ncbi:hypothetical protein TTHERM_001549938 (macronuclear) [Tetrahymena thermophila SB210]|uniref:Kinase domain protein n=1 Tax=Tetrahymena thermophila (strain SB210) TaxID=312017 RepID=W7XEI8_TETTS|nr:hypothetical protein TTHERM_001549938 [Tetrahymena thermophila SB210]EWS76132.1 hypothetical protein TTHERM_001549938 [Tetrahymena thermophila SB210]|eukprot:XP_012651332.1 hypothetical protein TTHERM_001549938 [Tetrahymena thermophila SB210]
MNTSEKSSVLQENEIYGLTKLMEPNLSLEQIKYLNLDFQQTTQDKFPMIASQIENCSNLKYLILDFSHEYGQIYVSRKQLSILGASITKCKQISLLQMDFTLQKIEENGVLFIASIIKGCKNLQILNLFGFGSTLRDEGLSRIATALPKCQKITKLAISFICDEISDEGLQNLGSALVNCQRLQELSLEICDNCFRDDGLSKLGLNLAKSVNLQVLKINTHDRNPTYIKPTSKGYYDLCAHLSNLNNLKEFFLGFCWEINGACLPQVGLALKTCKNLIKLFLLVRFEVSDKDTEEFAFHIQNYRNLIQFDILINLHEKTKKKLQRKIFKMPRIVCFSIEDEDFVDLIVEDNLRYLAIHRLEKQIIRIKQFDCPKFNDSNDQSNK